MWVENNLLVLVKIKNKKCSSQYIYVWCRSRVVIDVAPCQSKPSITSGNGLNGACLARSSQAQGPSRTRAMSFSLL